MRQKPRDSREDYDTVILDDLRPAGDGKHCFYCAQLLGGQHDPECVIRLGAGHYHVAIRNDETGEVRLFREDSAWMDNCDFMWIDGNYACDCNRHMMFARAIGEEPDWGSPCGHDRYSVLYAQLPDGQMIPVDYDTVVLPAEPPHG